MKRAAIIMTVFNRKETTLKCLSNLHKIIEKTHWVEIDIFMTDDGSRDNTSQAVSEKFPFVHICEGNGQLYWAGGMNLAWKFASQYCKYDYYIWVNDDAELVENAFELLFEPLRNLGERVIVSGAFKDRNGSSSYGGRNSKKQILTPNGTFQQVFFMNGNLTLIPANVVKIVGFLDETFLHIAGDWDYGLRAREKGIPVILTNDYVGITDRHDYDAFDGCLKQRLRRLYSVKHNPFRIWKFNQKHFGFRVALLEFMKQHIIFMCPLILEINHIRKKNASGGRNFVS